MRIVSAGKCFPPEQLLSKARVSAGGELGISRFMVLSSEDNSFAWDLRLNTWE